MTSASSRFAQNRRGMDRTIMQAFQTADVYDPNAIRDFRQRARAGLFSTDDGAFNAAQFQSAFETYLSLRPTTKVCPAGTARAGETVAESVDCDVAAAAGTGGQRSDSWWGGYSGTPFGDFERSGTGAAEAGDTDDIAGTGYFGPITPVDLRYGVPGQFFAKGGPVRKPVKSKPARGMSARSMLAQFSNGGEVTDHTPLAETDPRYIHEDPSYADKEVTPLADPQPDKMAFDELQELIALDQASRRETDTASGNISASMLESIGEGAAMIPETVANYFVRPGDKGPASFSMVSPSELGSDIKFLGGAVYEGAKAEPLRFAMDILPVIGELVSAHDVGKFTDMANQAEAEGKPALADMFRQIVTLSAAGAVPLAGMGARATKRSVISAARKAAEEATTTSARMLDEVAVAGATSPLRMLDEVVEETAKWMGPGWRWTLKKAEGTDVPYIRASNDFAEQIRARTPEPTNNNGYMGADVAGNTRVVGDPVAETFNRQIADDPMGMIELYKKIESTEGGKVHDTDAFRELSSNYLADRSLSPSVHEPASALNKTYYAMKLEETQGEPGKWLFTGGGPGSGKSSGPAGPLRDSADLVFDGTLAKFDTNVSRIDDALRSGKDVDIAFVDMAPEKAIRLAVMRAMNQVEEFGSGRTIPIDHFVQMHVDSRKTIKQLVERYKGNPDVRIKLINNNGGPNDAARLSEGFTIDQIADLDYDETVRRVTAVLEEMKLEGKGVISDDIYRGFTKNTRLDDTSPTTTPTLDTRRASSQGGTQRGNGQSVPRDAGQLGRERSQVQASTVEPLPIETTTAASTSARGHFDDLGPSVITASRESAEDIFGPGTSRITYLDEGSGGTITMLERPDGKPASVLELLVPEAERQKGVGARLQAHALQMHPNMGGQVSSRYAAKSAYDLGRRPVDAPDATLEDVYQLIEENSSVNLVSQVPAESTSARGAL